MDLNLHTDGPVLSFPEDTWRNDEREIARWHKVILEAVQWQNPWALLVERPDCDVWVFSCTHTGIWEAAKWGTRVRLLFAEGEGWDRSQTMEEILASSPG